MTADEEARRIIADVGKVIEVTDLKPGETLSVDFDLPSPDVLRVLGHIAAPSDCPNHPHPEPGVCPICGAERTAFGLTWH